MTDPRDDRCENLFTSLYDEACFERGKIVHEDELVNHRLLWLTTSQSIFFAAYVFGFAEKTGWRAFFVERFRSWRS